MTPVASRKSGSLPMVTNPQIHKEIENKATHKPVPAAKFIPSRELTTNGQDTVSLTTKLDIEGITVESGLRSGSDSATLADFQKRLVSDAAAIDSSNEKASISTCVTKEIQKTSSPDTLPQENRNYLTC